MTVTQMIREIPKLTLGEKMKLAYALDADEELAADNVLWDAQMREDLKPGGPLDGLIAKALAEDERGETEEWP